MLEFQRLQTEIAQRKDLLAKLKVEAGMVEQEREKAENLNNWLLQQIDTFRVPDVMDYVTVKASQHDLQKKLKGWMRKVEITTMQTKRYIQYKIECDKCGAECA
jgi:DNA repair exonuclease SbcCD ATPase subunit